MDVVCITFYKENIKGYVHWKVYGAKHIVLYYCINVVV